MVAGLNIYLEIISREDWKKKKSKYRKTFQDTFRKESYQDVAPQLFDFFRRLNGGKLAKTVVFDFKTKTKSKLNAHDMQLIPALLEAGYTVDKISYQTGKVLKDGKEINILDILNSLESKIKTKDKMKEVYEKTQNEAIKKQLNFIDRLDNFGLITGEKVDIRKLSIFQDKGQKIVFTYDHRAIASQSTEVGWTSCMNLTTGVYREKVGSGTAAGMFIAYLVNKGDEFELNSPTARVLIKPYYDDKGNVYWNTDPKVYGTAPNDFHKQVKKIIQVNQQETRGRFEISSDVYRDTSPTRVDIIPPQQQKLFDKLYASVEKNNDLDTNQEFINTLNKLEPYTQIKVLGMFRDKYDVWKHIKNPSNEVTNYCIQHDERFIKNIKNPTEEMLIKHVQTYDAGLGAIKVSQRTDKIIKAAIESRPSAIEFIKNPSLEIQMLAVSLRGSAIQHIKNPSIEVQKAAIDSRSYGNMVIHLIKNASDEIVTYSLTKRPSSIVWVKKPKESQIRLALSKANKDDVEHILDVFERENKINLVPKDMIYTLIKKNPLAVVINIPKLSEKQQMAIVMREPFLIRRLEKPSKEIQMFAVNKNIKHISHITAHPDVQKMALAKYGPKRFIQYIDEDDLTEDSMRTLIEYDIGMLRQFPSKTPVSIQNFAYDKAKTFAEKKMVLDMTIHIFFTESLYVIEKSIDDLPQVILYKIDSHYEYSHTMRQIISTPKIKRKLLNLLKDRNQQDRYADLFTWLKESHIISKTTKKKKFRRKR